MNEKDENFVKGMTELQVKGYELLYKHKIAKKVSGRISLMTKPFMDLWKNYYEEHQYSMAHALMFAVKSYCEGTTSEIENSLICQTITNIIEKEMPDHLLIQEINMRRGLTRMSHEDAESVVKQFGEHFDMQ